MSGWGLGVVATWLGMASIAARQRMQYRFDFFMMVVSTLLYSLLVYLVWSGWCA